MEAIGDVSLNSQRSPTEADFVSSRDDSEENVDLYSRQVTLNDTGET